jgi:hypothetical protein
MMYKEGNIEKCSPKSCYPVKEMINELVWAFVALIILHAKYIGGILFSSVAYLSVPYFFT